jgi:putative DNA primase/helicase
MARIKENPAAGDGGAEGIAGLSRSSPAASGTKQSPRQIIGYDAIRALAKSLRRPATTLIALSRANDPFWIRPQRRKGAEWFARIWRRFDFGDGVHLRRIHYVLVSTAKPVRLWDGKPYQNTTSCWDALCLTSRDARYLDLVPADLFVDRRNDEPVEYLSDHSSDASLDISFESPWVEATSSAMPFVPELVLRSPTMEQPYHIELWCEKTTVNDVLLDLGETYGVNVVTGAGELSLTACVKLIDRAEQSQRPVRILYVSDFDPAGQGMPVAVARKIQHRLQIKQLDHLDIQVRPVALTLEQCRQFRPAQIARALDGKCESGRLGVYYRCRCPLPTHGKGRGDHDRSLSVRDGDRRVLLKCFATCKSGEIFAELVRRGVIDPARNPGNCHHDAPRRRDDRDDAITPDPEALAIWRDSEAAAGSIIETKYLRGVRGITVPPPASLRYSQQPFQDRIVLPAMIAAVQAPDRTLIAVQITWLDRKTYQRFKRGNVGPLGQGAVRLAAATATLGIAEGVETALAAMQLHGVPVWATLGSTRMACVVVPDSVRELVIFGDNNAPGRAGADHAMRAHTSDDRRVVPCFPPAQFKDWAEVLASQRA